MLLGGAFLTASRIASPQLPSGSLPNRELTPEEMEQARLDSIARADSIALAERDSLVGLAAEGYKHLKFIQYDGVTQDVLYPETMKVYRSVEKAMGHPRIDQEQTRRMHGMLTDIQNLFLKGALYYSGAGKSAEMADFATAFVDIRRRPDMKDLPLSGEARELYPALVYSAASSTYNRGDYPHAIDYFEEYLSTDATDRREQVCLFLAQACINAQTPERGIERLLGAVDLYPANTNLLMLTLQNCLDGGYTDKMQPLLDKALFVRPNDEQLLNLQARLYENDGKFKEALDIFNRLYDLKPNSLSVNQHLALCYYNLGAEYYNRSIMEPDEKLAKKQMRQSNAYFTTAADKLATVVDNDPTNPKYLRALGLTYGCLGRAESLEEINTRLTALGQPTLKMNGMPEAIVFAERQNGPQGAGASQASHVPDFQEFAKTFVESNLAKWSERREFEKTEDYEKRINQDNVYGEYQRLCKEAETEYLKKYAGRLRISDLKLMPYDTDNETYLIESAMGEIVVNVPLKNKEAESFKNSWNTIQLRNPRYYIRDNRVAIASVDLVTSTGKTYSYNSANAANYDFTDVTIDIDSFLSKGAAMRGHTAQRQSGAKQNVIRAKSDVDRDIPVTSRKAEKTVALIMANENYKNVTNVASALNDGETFAQYCTMTLGIPQSQVLTYENLTYAEMVGAMAKARNLVGALGDGVDVIVYYAGHGFPDEATKDAFLLPVDGDGYTTAVSYPLKRLYSELSQMRAENVMVFLDACFSGSTRDGGMLAEARGVALKPRAADPEGNMFVLSAASDQETALPYKEKNHGLFTYFLLKKLQDTKGNVTLKDLGEYVKETVKRNSLTVNSKLQTPSIKVSGRLAKEWDSKKLRP